SLRRSDPPLISQGVRVAAVSPRLARVALCGAIVALPLLAQTGSAGARAAAPSADPCAGLAPAVATECRKGVAACQQAKRVSSALVEKCLSELERGLDPLRKKGTSSTSADTGSAATGTGDSGSSAAGVSRRSVSASRSRVVVSASSIPADGVAPILVHVIL